MAVPTKALLRYHSPLRLDRDSNSIEGAYHGLPWQPSDGYDSHLRLGLAARSDATDSSLGTVQKTTSQRVTAGFS